MMTAPKKPATQRPRVARPKKAKAAEPVAPVTLPPPWVRISDTMVSRSAYRASGAVPNAFEISSPMPGVLPKSHVVAPKPGHPGMAMDEQVIEVNAWAAQQVYNGAFFNGLAFLGYPLLAEMAQRPEYRRISETIAMEMTRKWVKIQTTGDEKAKAGRIAELTAEMGRLDVQGAFRKVAELDGFFGRSHLYLDTGDTDSRDELVTSIGNGRDETTRVYFRSKKGFLRAIKPIEPVWCYPAKYNANDPLKPDWYNPQTWFVQGKEIHSTRFLTFVGREVTDLLKPAYMFGGISMSQLAKPYVDNWLRTRQAVADLIWSFSVRGLKTNMGALSAADGTQLINRAAVFANMQNNQGLMILDKDTEDFFNIQTALGGLDSLQAATQEHMCSVTGIPVVKLLGIQPAGLNASSEGELTVWYDWIESFQEKMFTEKLARVIDFIQLSLWGEVDPDITFAYESLRSLSELEKATKRKTEADTDAVLIDASIISPAEARRRVAQDPDTPYDGLDPDELPETQEEAVAPGEEGAPEADAGGEEGEAPDSSPLLSRLASRRPEDDSRRIEEPRRAERAPRRTGRDAA